MTDLKTRSRAPAASRPGDGRRSNGGRPPAATAAEPVATGTDPEDAVPTGRAPEARMFPARIAATGPDAQSFTVRADPDPSNRRARTADSCLIRPDLNDLVLCAAYPSGDGTALYILSVLVRADVSRPAILNAAGGLTVTAPDGPVTIQSEQSINLFGGAGMNLAAENLSIRAEAAIVNLDSAVLESENAVARIGTMRLLGDMLVSLVKVVSGHHQRASRKVDEVDLVQADEVVVKGERLISHSAEQIVHVSTEDMRFDGARIHMG